MQFLADLCFRVEGVAFSWARVLEAPYTPHPTPHTLQKRLRLPGFGFHVPGFGFGIAALRIDGCGAGGLVPGKGSTNPHTKTKSSMFRFRIYLGRDSNSCLCCRAVKVNPKSENRLLGLSVRVGGSGFAFSVLGFWSRRAKERERERE